MSNINDVIKSVNKAIGAVVGGGLITVLVGVHLIPSSVGNTLLALLGVAAAVLGAFLAPQNRPIPPVAPEADDDMGAGELLPEDAVDAAPVEPQDPDQPAAGVPPPHVPEHATPDA